MQHDPRNTVLGGFRDGGFGELLSGRDALPNALHLNERSGLHDLPSLRIPFVLCLRSSFSQDPLEDLPQGILALTLKVLVF
jgi:hypothetical protein